MKIRDRIDALYRTAPKRNVQTGQLYKNAAQQRGKYSRIRLHVILVSSLNEHRLHEIVFNKAAGKTPQEWAAWLELHARKIFSGSILPGLNVINESRTWSVAKFVGWTGEQLKGKRNAERKPDDSKMASKRHKAKRQGARGGKNNLRRGHGNRKRKA